MFSRCLHFEPIPRKLGLSPSRQTGNRGQTANMSVILFWRIRGSGRPMVADSRPAQKAGQVHDPYDLASLKSRALGTKYKDTGT